MVANSTVDTPIIVSIFEPMIAFPRARVTSTGAFPRRCGQSISSAPRARATNAPTEIAHEPRLLWTIDMGINPAGFIMNINMKTTMIDISITIMRMVITPR